MVPLEYGFQPIIYHQIYHKLSSLWSWPRICYDVQQRPATYSKMVALPVRTSTDYGKPPYSTIYIQQVYGTDDHARVYTHTGVLNLVYCRLGDDGTSCSVIYRRVSQNLPNRTKFSIYKLVMIFLKYQLLRSHVYIHAELLLRL